MTLTSFQDLRTQFFFNTFTANSRNGKEEIFEGEISKHEYPWHFHNCYTVVLVESGSINYEFRDINLSVDKEEVLIIEPNAIHRNTISQPTVYKALFLSI